MNTFSGNYPIQHRVGEIERLGLQSTAMVADTVAMLERFGPMTGWICLDLGCGPGGITDLLSARVGATGRVIGLDMNAQFLDHARENAPDNVEFRLGNAYQSDLPAGAFDLVHMRFVASTAGAPEQLLKEATRLARHGGIVALQEPDGLTLACYPPHPAWDLLHAAYMAAFKGVGSDLTLARRIYHVVHEAGLHDVQYRTAILGVRSIDPMVDYLPSMIESLRAAILKLGLFTEDDLVAALAECRQHLAKPGTAFTMWTLAQVWGWTTSPVQ
jgi:ubiquinone/menaquinone biosynthesis C-methylase UbiE